LPRSTDLNTRSRLEIRIHRFSAACTAPLLEFPFQFDDSKADAVPPEQAQTPLSSRRFEKGSTVKSNGSGPGIPMRRSICLFVWHVWRTVIGAEEENGGCHAWPSQAPLILEPAKIP
jgi:hypothetical protein